ncbi:MAG: nicotinate-nucleotide adenylyltransferase [Lachnospiraceae bacterium]|nr:nicotinate-nucleotide adenylyltransferase [Lachnospiraceae bacterium]
MKIGVMGGTFDPIHNGHLMLGQAALEAFDLDKVWYMPNGNPPHKDTALSGTDVQDRVEMVRLAISSCKKFRLETYEANRNDVSYSYRTMEYFKGIYPEDDFYFIIGADSLFMIDQWVHPERLFPTCTILAAYRDEINTREAMEEKIHELKETYHAQIRLLVTPLIRISSHELREDVSKGRSIAGWVPDSVNQYILDRQLYEDEAFLKNQKMTRGCDVL